MKLCGASQTDKKKNIKYNAETKLLRDRSSSVQLST
jgi:hypothetical protein